MTWDECQEKTQIFSAHYSLTPNQQQAVYNHASKLHNGAVIVEIGVANGKTAATFLCAIDGKKIAYTGVDNWSLTGNYEQVKNQLDSLNIPHTLVVADSRTLAWDTPIDLLLIDGGHEESCVKPDCEHWVHWVKPGGLVMFHDYDEPFTMDSPHWAVRAYADQETQGWEDVDFIKGLKIKRRPK